MNLNENYLHKVIRESINKVLNEAIDRNGLIKDVLFSGHCYNTNNKKGYDIGIGYGCGTTKEFYYPYSESMEYSYCHVSVDEINKVVRELESLGYEFKNDGGFVSMCGEYNSRKQFVPKKPRGDKRGGAINPNLDPVGYYSDRLFKNSDGGNLHLF